MNKIDEKRLATLLSTLPLLSKSDKELVEKAYFFAKKAHRGQKRLSGKPYFFHTYKTGEYLAELGMDAATIAAGLLHDVIEDTDVTEEEFEKEFPEEVSFLVHGVTKLGHLKYRGLERHVESLRKLFVAITHDVRVLIIKLVDRLHNMETLKHVREEKQKRIALETLEIYAPLADRLGIGRLKGQLEDLAFGYIYPEELIATKKLLKTKGHENKKRLEKLSHSLMRRLADAGIRVEASDFRIKRLYSLFKKLKRKDMNIDKVYDVAALRIIVPSIEDCYRALGVIHERWKPLPGRIKDYIATPKPNGYRSLHTTIFTGDGGIVEIQIRTQEMHHEAAYGIASHFSYKTGKKETQVEWILRMLSPFNNKADATKNGTERTMSPNWFQELTEIQKHIDDPSEFLRSLKTDFFDERVFVFTPKGDVIDLPGGATPIDFAYTIHTDIGNHMEGAKVNGKLASLDTPLGNGDIVDIQTKKSARPNRKWIEHAKTTLAKRKIRGALTTK